MTEGNDTTATNTIIAARRLLDSELNVVNIGLEIFSDALKLQNIRVVDVNWNPPPKLDKETKDLLDKIL